MKTNSENKKKLHISARAKLVPAIAMLSTSAIMLSTSTYAWFTMNKEVQITGLQMTATASESLEISLGKPTTTDQTTTLSVPGDNDDDYWSNAFAVSNCYDKIGRIKPASSVNGKDFFYALDATAQGKEANKFAAVESNETVKTTLQALNKSDNKIDCDDDAAAGYYVDIPFYIRTRKKATTDENLFAAVKISNIDSTSNDELYKAVRVAILQDTASSKIFYEDSDYYDSGIRAISKANNTATDPSKSGVLADVNLFTKTENSNPCHEGANTTLKLSKDPKSDSDFRQGAYTIRVWLEGESTSCYDSNSGQSWNIDLKFGLSDEDITDFQ